MSGSSEERNLPASAKKLADERKKGRIPKAPDMQSGLISIVLIVWLLGSAGMISQRMEALIHTAGEATTLPFDQAGRTMTDAMREALVHCALIPLLVAVVSAFFAGLLINRGFIFAVDPLLPKLDKINPLNGFKNLFKPKNFIDLGLSVVKVLAFGAILATITLRSLNELVRAPDLTPEALPGVLWGLLMPMMATACAFYAIVGIADFFIQKNFFMKEMRMTQTEAKNERKEMMGNPQIKSQRARLANEMRNVTVRLGPKQATIMICREDVVVGIRYKPGDTPVPRIVCVGRGAAAERYRDIAREEGIPMCWNRELAADLHKAFRPGMTITQAFFNPVAHALQNTSA